MRALFVLVPLVLASASCSTANAKAFNLDELHEADGRHKRRAALVTDWEYLVRQGLMGLVLRQGRTMQAKEPERVKNPLAACIENLVGLADASSSVPETAARQVALFGRLALIDAWPISRALCVEYLGHAGVRLELAQHPAPVTGPTPAGPLGPDALREVLRELIRAVDAGDTASVTAQCEDLSELDLDVAGATRLLEGLSALALAAGSRDATANALGAASLQLQRVIVRSVLDAAWNDAAEVVRVEVLRARSRSFGIGSLAAVVRDLPAERQPGVAIAVCELVRARGLPIDHPDQLDHFGGTDLAGLDVAGRDAERVAELAGLYEVVAARATPERLRVAAMRALGRASGGELSSLREEDWQRWWYDRASAAAEARP